MDPDWQKFKVNGKTPVEIKAREVKDFLVSDTWWDELDYLLSFTESMMDFLRVADTDASILHLIYDMWDTMIEEVKKRIFELESLDLLTDKCEFFYVVQQVIEARWNKSNTSLHCLAHSLVPKYYCQNWLQGGGNGVRRVSPNEDDEVSANRVKCFHRLFKKEKDIHQVFLEHGAFAENLGKFSEFHVIAAREYEDSLSWWANYGSSALLLQRLAYKLLSQLASSSCCERNWSSFGYIQSNKRNRLKPDTLEDLVYIRNNNLRLLSRKKKEYNEGPTKYWDLGGDQFGENPLQFAELSLNDPAIEAMTFE